MSRYYDGDDGPEYDNAYELWQANAKRALKGKRGRKALAELREALQALPEKRLIARALCTVGPEKRRPQPVTNPSGETWDWAGRDFDEIVSEQGQGVCAVGAYVWWQKVKAGADPTAAFDELPTLDDANHDLSETAYLGKNAGLTVTLAWTLAYRNDEDLGDCTPEERHARFIAWIDGELSESAA